MDASLDSNTELVWKSHKYSDGCKTNLLVGDLIQKRDDARLWMRAHPIRCDSRIEEPTNRSVHVSLSPANSTFRYA